MRSTALVSVSSAAGVPASSSGERCKTFRNASTTAGRQLVAVALRALSFPLLLAAVLPCAAQSDTTPPTVAIVSPPSGATLCGTVPIVASASDNVGVVGVQFKHDGVDIGAEDTTAPYAVAAYTTAVANGSHTLTAVARDAAGNVTASAPVTVAVANTTPHSGSCKFIPSFLVYFGGGPALVLDDAPKLARFEGIGIDRFRYVKISPNADTWTEIKSYNPSVQIFVYEAGAEDSNFHDGLPQANLNDIARYDLSRGHPMGSLNGNHPELFLLDSAGSRIYDTGRSNVAANQYWYAMDFGAATYQSYWLTAVKADIVDQPWIADGVFADECIAVKLIDFAAYSGIPAKYSSYVDWDSAMNSFAGAISAGLHGYGQRLWCNRGNTRFPDGSGAWRSLDASVSPPDVVLEEGAFAVMWR